MTIARLGEHYKQTRMMIQIQTVSIAVTFANGLVEHYEKTNIEKTVWSHN